MNKRIQNLLAQIKEKNDAVCAIWDADDEKGAPGLSKDDRDRVIALNKEIEDLEKQVADLQEDDVLREVSRDRKSKLDLPANRLPQPAGEEKKADPERVALISPGQAFLDSEEFKAWMKQIAPDGQIPQNAKGFSSPPVRFKTLLTGASATSAGALVMNDMRGLLDVGAYRRPLTLLDIITRGETTSDMVEYVREGAHTNNAATVAEATAASGASGAKPESAMLLAIVQEAVKTIAHWIPATRRALADAGQLRTLIDTFLRYGLEEELTDQIIAGDGTGENFTGLLNISGTTAQAYDTNLLTTTRKARTKVRVTGRATPTAYVLHPNNWEALDLLQDNEARYYFGGPSVIGSPRLWGLPVVEEEGMTEGTGMVADWRLAVLWERMQAAIYVSDSHADFFVRNLIAILAEMRAAFGVLRPAAFVEIDLTP